MRSINISLLFLCLIGYTASGQKKLSFPNNSTYQVALIASKATYEIPVTLLPGISEAPDVRTLSIYTQDLTPIAATVIQSNIRKDALNNLWLHLEINNTPALPAGKYSILLQETKPDSPKAPPETYPIEITIKAATLETPATIISNISGGNISSQKLLFYNKPNNSYPSPVTIEKISLVGPDKSSLLQDINFKVDIIRGESSQTTKISPDYKDTKIPLGKSVGSYRIYAPQLSQPVPFTLEINKKRWDGLIFLMIFLGLIIGFITKELLTRKKALNSSMNTAFELIKKLQTEKESRPDQEYTNQINGLIQMLGDSLPKKYDLKAKEKIDAAISAAEKSLIQFNTEFTANIQRLQTELNSMHSAVSPLGLFLPKSIFSITQQATAQIENILQLTVNNRYTDAKQQFSTLKNDLVVNLKKEVEQFKEFYLQTFTDIKNSTFTISSLPVSIATVPDELISSIRTLEVNNDIQQPDSIRSLLESIKTINSKIKDFVQNLSTGINTLLSTIAKIISQINNSLQSEIDDKKKEITIALTVSNNPIEDIMAPLSVKLNDLQQWLISKMTADPALTSTQIAEIKKELSEGKYIDAANALVTLKTVVTKGALPTANLEANQLLYETDLNYNNAFYLSSLFPSATPAAPQTKPLTATNTVTQLMAITQRRTFVLDLVQTIIIGIGIMITGYFIYIDKYTGTDRELFEIFMWAYMLNITAETLATQFNLLPKIQRS